MGRYGAGDGGPGVAMSTTIFVSNLPMDLPMIGRKDPICSYFSPLSRKKSPAGKIWWPWVDPRLRSFAFLGLFPASNLAYEAVCFL
jgi:hypothetical protein